MTTILRLSLSSSPFLKSSPAMAVYPSQVPRMWWFDMKHHFYPWHVCTVHQANLKQKTCVKKELGFVHLIFRCSPFKSTIQRFNQALQSESLPLHLICLGKLLYVIPKPEGDLGEDSLTEFTKLNHQFWRIPKGRGG